MNRQSPPRLRAGFTLVELLVVIVIAVILAAILLPVMGKVRRDSLSTQCLSNIRSYASAALAFAADKGGFPYWDGKGAAETTTGKADWHEWLVPNYLAAIPRCPLKPVDETRGFYYGVNSGLNVYFPKLVVPMESNRIALVAEASAGEGFWSATHFNMSIWGNSSGIPGDKEGGIHAPRYHGSPERRGLLIVFLDGHSEMVSSPTNDWKKGNPTWGTYKTSGYIYDRDQLGEIARNVWHLK